MQIENIEKLLINLIKKEFNLDGNEIQSNNNFTNLGIDSLKMIKLVILIENEFNLEIDDEEVIPENFDSIKSISKLILDKLNL